MPEIRYTKGPDEIGLGDVQLKINEWVPVSDELAAQALLPGRVEANAFESRTVKAKKPAADAPNEEVAK